MSQPHPDLQALSERGMNALRGGDAQAARRDLEVVLDAGHASVPACVMLAVACQRLGDRPGMDRALEAALALEPANLHALFLKGELLVAAGENRAALQYYDYALSAAPQDSRLPPEVTALLERARAESTRIRAQMHEHLLAALHAAGYREEQASARFNQAIDLLTGRKQRFVQEPRGMYFPELPDIQFHPRDAFPFLDAIEAETDAIEAELRAVLAAEESFQPYLQAEPGAPAQDTAKLARHAGWRAFFLSKGGQPVAENAARCPRTLAALERLPLMRVPGRGPSILFSLLRPGQRIEPHSGFLNARLICHLPLLAPPGCFLRVGNEVREWRRGKAWVFNDTIEHEAWNASQETRVVLIFDIWRPELGEDERRFTSALLASADSYGGSTRRWEV